MENNELNAELRENLLEVSRHLLTLTECIIRLCGSRPDRVREDAPETEKQEVPEVEVRNTPDDGAGDKTMVQPSPEETPDADGYVQPSLPFDEPEEPAITLEEVRSVLASRSRDGFTAEVRKLITGFGAEKLSGIDPSRYGEVMKAAEAIGNA